MEVKAFAKINLTLDVVGIREDGYHELCMVMHSVGLYDTVRLQQTDSKTITLKSDLPYLPVDSGNHAYRAAALFFEETGVKNSGLAISIKKQIPVAAGLAGGSSDAAAVLKGLNEYYRTGLTQEQLCRIGLKIGADVPYCLCGGTMLAKGVGEQLSPLPTCPKLPIILCKPNFGVSTPEAFRHWDTFAEHTHPDTDAVIRALEEKNAHKLASLLCNSLEDAVFDLIRHKKKQNPLPRIKRVLSENGAIGTLMSGSGPTIFGLFDNQKQCERALKAVRTLPCRSIMTTT